MKNTVRRLLAALVVLAMVLSVSGSVFALESNGQANTGALEAKTTATYDLSGIRNGNTFNVSENKADAEIAADQIVPIMVQLQDAPAMKVYSSYKAAGNYAASLREKQDAAVKSIGKALNVDIKVLYNYTLLFNGFAFEGEYRLVEELNRMEGVTAFVAAEWESPDPQLFNSGDMVGAIDAWDLDYTGEGRAIAIVDTGMKVDHPAFANAPENPKFVKDDIIAAIASGELQGTNMNADNVYYSAKIPFRWNYVKNSYNVNHTSVGSDHGTHVGGIAAGNGGEITGVAKDAQLLAMNVFNDGGGAGWVAILAALEDCVVLGVDSANLSLGSPCGFTHYYSASYAETFENLVNAGVNLSMSAGNEYSTALGNTWGGGGSNLGYPLVFNPDYGVTGSPSTWPRSLGVASVDNSKAIANYIENEATGKFGYSETDYNQPKLAATFGGQTLDYVYIPGAGNPEDFEGYDVAGKVALIQRGDISFYVKIENAQALGAIAVIIFNNTSGIINMNLQDGNITVPAVSIALDYGSTLAEAGEGQIFISAEPELIDALGGGQPSEFSSWGTTSDLKIKPEITAPGGNIYSSTDPSISGGLYDTWSGTSMSAPHVSGGMAIVSQYVDEMFPDLSTGEKREMVDTILMSTANPVVDGGGDLAAVRKQGAGLMDLAAAVTTTSYLSVEGNVRPKLELGDDPEMTGVYEMTFTVHNFGETALSYVIEPHVLLDDLTAVAVDPDGNYVIATTQKSWDIADYCDFEMPDAVNVGPGETADVTVVVTLTDDILEYIDAYYPLGCYVEGFIELYGQGGMTGDVDGDGDIDTADALAVMRYVMGVGELEDVAAADVNGSGDVTMADALLILRYATGVSTDFEIGGFEAGQDLNIPFLAFYGDWNYVPMFDLGFYYDDFSYGSNPQINFVGSAFGSSAYGLGINPYVETEDYSYYMDDRNAVSPNGDGFLDTADLFRLGLMRNAAEAGYQLIDANGNVLANLAHDEDVRKSYYSTSAQTYSNLGTDLPMPRWNAEPYGGQDIAIRAYAYLSNDGSTTTEPFTEDTENFFNEWIIPIYVDVAAPTAEVVSFENGVLTLNVTDEHYVAYVGAWDANIVNGEVVLNANYDQTGLFEEERGAVSEVALENVVAGALICLGDYAGNEVAYTFDGTNLVPASDSWSHGGVSVPGTTFYAFGKNLTSQTWVKFNSDNLDATPTYGGGIQSDAGDYTCGTFTGDTVYAVTNGKELVKYDASDIDAWTGKTTIGTLNASYTVNEMAYNRANGKLYVVVGVTDVYEVNVQTAAMTQICSTNYGIVAMDFDREGTCYIVDAFGYLCTFDIATGTQTAEIGYYGVNPVNTSTGSFLLQCGTLQDGYFFWVAADAGITQYSQIHLLAIKVNTGDYMDLGAVWGGLYTLCLFAYKYEVPPQSVEATDFYENFEGDFVWETIDADGDGNNWGTDYWGEGLYYDGSKAAVSYSWLDVVLYPDNWMVSPEFTIGEGEKWLSYFAASANQGAGADIDEHWQVIVIPEGMDVTDGIVVEETTMTTAMLTEHLVDLSQFAGETVRIAFRHFNCSDEYTLIIDGIAVGDHK